MADAIGSRSFFIPKRRNGASTAVKKLDDATTVSQSISARWTQKIADGGWTPIATVFLERYSLLGITAVEAMFITHLMSFKRDSRMPYPSFSTIGKKMGVSTSAARGYARRLEKHGMIRRVGRNGQTSQFDLTPLFERLEKMSSRDTVGQGESRYA